LASSSAQSGKPSHPLAHWAQRALRFSRGLGPAGFCKTACQAPSETAYGEPFTPRQRPEGIAGRATRLGEVARIGLFANAEPEEVWPRSDADGLWASLTRWPRSAPRLAPVPNRCRATLDAGIVRAGHRSLVVACRGSKVAGKLLEIAPTCIERIASNDFALWDGRTFHLSRVGRGCASRQPCSAAASSKLTWGHFAAVTAIPGRAAAQPSTGRAWPSVVLHLSFCGNAMRLTQCASHTLRPAPFLLAREMQGVASGNRELNA